MQPEKWSDWPTARMHAFKSAAKWVQWSPSLHGDGQYGRYICPLLMLSHLPITILPAIWVRSSLKIPPNTLNTRILNSLWYKTFKDKMRLSLQFGIWWYFAVIVFQVTRNFPLILHYTMFIFAVFFTKSTQNLKLHQFKSLICRVDLYGNCVGIEFILIQ